MLLTHTSLGRVGDRIRVGWKHDTFHLIPSKMFWIFDPQAQHWWGRIYKQFFLWRSTHFMQFLAKNVLALDPPQHPHPNRGWTYNKNYFSVQICTFQATLSKKNLFCTWPIIHIPMGWRVTNMILLCTSAHFMYFLGKKILGAWPTWVGG